jgi:hypothetical protein
MSLSVDPELLSAMIANPGAVKLVLVAGAADAEQALAAARQIVIRVRHPEEPSEQAASFVSAVESTGAGAEFWFDMADCEELMPQVLADVVAAIERLVHGDAALRLGMF